MDSRNVCVFVGHVGDAKREVGFKKG